MTNLRYTDKFIAFIDVLGWESLVRASQEGSSLSLSELSEILMELGTNDDQKQYEKHGPTICPEAPHTNKDVGFCITCASDSALISTEISPAGIISLIFHCWSACFKLLSKGIMCRGYIKRGQIYHTPERQIGTGLSEAVKLEQRVSIFKHDADERSTPFIEVDAEVVQYIKQQPDRCVKEMFSRMTKSEDDLTAIFPFQRLNHDFAIAGLGVTFDPEKERKSVNNIRGWIHTMKEQLNRHIDPTSESALKKGNHYIRMLDAQLIACDRTEEAIDLFSH